MSKSTDSAVAFTLEKAGAAASVSTQTIILAIRDKALRARRISDLQNSILITRSDLEEWVNSLPHWVKDSEMVAEERN